MTAASLLRPADAAVYLGVSVRQLQRLTAAGMPCVPVGARAVRYEAQACMQWLQANGEGLRDAMSAPRVAIGTRPASANAAAAFMAASNKARLRVRPSPLVE